MPEKNDPLATLAKNSTHKATAKAEKAMDDVLLSKTPYVTHYHSEEDSSAFLNLLEIHHYQMITGCLNWTIKLGRIDAICDASLLNHFYAGPR